MSKVAGTKPFKRNPPVIRGKWGYFVAVGAMVVALAFRLAVDRKWGDQMPYTTFFVAAILCIGLTEFGPSLLSIAGGFLLANWFFVSPRYSLEVVTPERLPMMCAYLIDLGIVLGFATWAKRALDRERAHSEALRERTTELEASEKRYHTLAEAAFEGILFSQNGRIVDCNEQVAALVECTREELLGKLATDFIAPEQRALVAKNIQEERSAAYELDLIYKNGKRRSVEAHGRPMQTSDGESLRVSVVRDISDRKRWEETMRRRTEELERLMNALPAAVWIAHDRNCTKVTGNQSANALLGVRPGTNVSQKGAGEASIQYFKSDGCEYPLEELPLQRAAATGRPVQSVEVEFRFGDGRRAWLLGGAEPLFDAEGVCRGAVAAFMDVSERKHAEEALRSARDELARTNDQLEQRVAERTRSLEEKTAELNAFCYSLAHDFRAPLRTQEGFARILIEDYAEKLGEPGANLAWRVLRAAQRQSDIIQDLLAHISVTRSELPLEPVELKKAFAQARADLELELQDKKAEIHEEELTEIRVIANPSSLHLILLNLLTNAFKFVRPDTAPVVRLWTERRGDSVRLWIEDNGIGISTEDVGKLFRMFKRLNANVYPGTGMGLAIVKKAAERIGGSVGVESEPGRGSRFWVEVKSAGEEKGVEMLKGEIVKR
jgi:PAS domain S-box-containing protein